MIKTVTQNSNIEKLKQNLEGRERACEELRSKHKKLSRKLVQFSGRRS